MYLYSSFMLVNELDLIKGYKSSSFVLLLEVWCTSKQ